MENKENNQRKGKKPKCTKSQPLLLPKDIGHGHLLLLHFFKNTMYNLLDGPNNWQSWRVNEGKMLP